MHLSNDILKHAVASNETIIVVNNDGDPSYVVIPYQKYLRLLYGAAPDGLTKDKLLDTINREIAQREDEQQLPLMSESESNFVDAPENNQNNDEEEQLYLEDIETKS